MKNIKPILTCLVASLAIACSSDNNDNENNVITNNGTETNNGTVTNNGTATNNNGTVGNNKVDATCAEYCDAVTASCSGTDAQYDDNGICLDYCTNVSGWEPGKVGDTDGNTVACRLYHAGVAAAMESETHCPHAGPSGAGVCGSYCDTYCALMSNNCDSTYADDAACMTACGDFPDTGSPGDTKYDTVQCRIYHAGAPAAVDGALHCGHAGVSPTGFCIGQPTDFAFRTDAPSAYTRVDRMGMPAISTAVITDKDGYNDDTPAGDVAGTYVPEIVTNLRGLHAALDDDLAGAGLTPCTIAVDGAGSCVAQAAPLVIPDTLKIDPSAAAGFPNGRRLVDPVMDVTLAVVLLELADGTHAATDLVGVLNPTENDKGVEGAFLTTFPYLHAPHTP